MAISDLNKGAKAAEDILKINTNPTSGASKVPDAPIDQDDSYEPVIRRNGPSRVKHVGSYRNPKIKTDEVLFKSAAKSMNIMVEDDYSIQFVSHTYSTNDPFEIKFLTDLATGDYSTMKTEIFLKEFPDYIIDKIKADSDILSKIPIEPDRHTGLGKR